MSSNSISLPSRRQSPRCWRRTEIGEPSPTTRGRLCELPRPKGRGLPAPPPSPPRDKNPPSQALRPEQRQQHARHPTTNLTALLRQEGCGGRSCNQRTRRRLVNNGDMPWYGKLQHIYANTPHEPQAFRHFDVATLRGTRTNHSVSVMQIDTYACTYSHLLDSICSFTSLTVITHLNLIHPTCRRQKDHHCRRHMKQEAGILSAREPAKISVEDRDGIRDHS